MKISSDQIGENIEPKDQLSFIVEGKTSLFGGADFAFPTLQNSVYRSADDQSTI